MVVLRTWSNKYKCVPHTDTVDSSSGSFRSGHNVVRLREVVPFLIGTRPPDVAIVSRVEAPDDETAVGLDVVIRSLPLVLLFLKKKSGSPKYDVPGRHVSSTPLRGCENSAIVFTMEKIDPIAGRNIVTVAPKEP